MNDDTKEELVECPKCGSAEFCVIQKYKNKVSYLTVWCRQCNKLFGIVRQRAH